MARIGNCVQIQAALRAYLNSRCEHEAILKDATIQRHYEHGEETEARRLIAERYPFGTWEQVHDYAIALIEEMYRLSPIKVDAEELWRNPKLFHEAVKLAARS